MEYTDYLIIGGGIAGISAARAIREQDPAGSILLLSGEPCPPYSRPMLTKKPLSTFSLANFALYPPEWYAENRITLRTGITVRSLDTENRCAHTDIGSFVWRSCILATGASNFVPPFPGKEKQGLFTIRTAEDMLRIKREAVFARRAVIIGGGVIGLECALQLQEYGLEVTVLEAMEYLMPRQLDRDTSETFRKSMADMTIHTNVKIRALTGEDRISAVELEDGRSFPCDFLIVACGARANIALAQEAGIVCERGIVVNERMETSAPAVYACGDCSQYNGINLALWSQGMGQGRVAGANAAGGDAVYTGCDPSLIINTAGASLLALGDLTVGEGCSCSVEHTEIIPEYAVNRKYPYAIERRVYCGDRLKGVTLIGNLSAMYELKEKILGRRN